MKYDVWTNDEYDIIRNNMGKPARAIAELLPNRNISSVKNKICRLRRSPDMTAPHIRWSRYDDSVIIKHAPNIIEATRILNRFSFEEVQKRYKYLFSKKGEEAPSHLPPQYTSQRAFWAWQEQQQKQAEMQR